MVLQVQMAAERIEEHPYHPFLRRARPHRCRSIPDRRNLLNLPETISISPRLHQVASPLNIPLFLYLGSTIQMRNHEEGCGRNILEGRPRIMLNTY